jgi:hypothetical protein
MPERLPASVQALVSELLDLCVHAEAEALSRGLPPGSVVSKEIGGRKHWYLQTSVGETRRQRYLGPDQPALQRWVESAREARRDLAADAKRRERLVEMAVRGGAEREPAASASVLRLLSDHGVFRLGGVLVGTRAFRLYGPMLGVRLDTRAAQTEDIDVAHRGRVRVAIDETVDATAALTKSGMGFLPVPGFDPRLPASSFKVRGRELRVDFLTPERRRGVPESVPLPALGVHATPLPFLEFLLEDSQPAVALAGAGILVRVPEPGRFALHKLFVAGSRPASELARARKDRVQAQTLLTLLREERPASIDLALEALGRRSRVARRVLSELDRLDVALP